MLFGLWTRMGPRKHVFDGVHIGAIWQIRLNHPRAAVMRYFCQITLTTCSKLLWLDLDVQCDYKRDSVIVKFNSVQKNTHYFLKIVTVATVLLSSITTIPKVLLYCCCHTFSITVKFFPIPVVNTIVMMVNRLFSSSTIRLLKEGAILPLSIALCGSWGCK